MKALCAVSLIALVALGGCVSEAEKDRREEARRIEVAQQAVAQELRDPSSAQFSEVEYYDYDVCGIVRGKNAFGGYGEPVKFVVGAAGTATLDPRGEQVPAFMAGVQEAKQCVFDTDYRRCRGEVISTSLERCLTGWQMGSPGQIVDEGAAKELCRQALEKRFNEDIRPATLRTVSAKAERTEQTWRVRLTWEASSEQFSGLSATGQCAVQDDGNVLVNRFRIE